MLVLDCSVVAAWLLKDESLPESYRRTVHSAAAGEVESHGPALLPYEFANVLAVAVKQGRLTESEAAQAVSFFNEFPVKVAGTRRTPVGKMLDMATNLGLSAYDASYLVLAKELGAHLVTLDQELARAAANIGVEAAPQT